MLFAQRMFVHHALGRSDALLFVVRGSLVSVSAVVTMRGAPTSTVHVKSSLFVECLPRAQTKAL